jgi:hypothetical protein
MHHVDMNELSATHVTQARWNRKNNRGGVQRMQLRICKFAQFHRDDPYVSPNAACPGETPTSEDAEELW